MNRKRVVVAGLGDVGVLAAIRLSRHADVVGISAKPALVSGQELGVRLSRPHDWARDYWIPFDRFRRLDGVRTVQATLTGVDLAARTVFGRGDDGAPVAEPYDALVICTGVSNGFWRRPTLQSAAEIGADLRDAHERLAAAGSVIVVGGGAAAVSSALNMARTWPDKRIDLYFPGETALRGHHPRAWRRLHARLTRLGVGVHPGHRAVLPDRFAGDELTSRPVQWSTGQPPAAADAVLWAIGRVRPNTGWLPAELLDKRGFVRVTPQLRCPGTPACSRSATSRPPIRCAARRATAATRWWRAMSSPSSLAEAARLPGAEAALGFAGGDPARRAGSLLAQRSYRALPVLVGATRGDAPDRAVGHVRRGAPQRPAGAGNGHSPTL